jgi:hypothetical protein
MTDPRKKKTDDLDPLNLKNPSQCNKYHLAVDVMGLRHKKILANKVVCGHLPLGDTVSSTLGPEAQELHRTVCRCTL